VPFKVLTFYFKQSLSLTFQLLVTCEKPLFDNSIVTNISTIKTTNTFKFWKYKNHRYGAWTIVPASSPSIACWKIWYNHVQGSFEKFV